MIITILFLFHPPTKGCVLLVFVAFLCYFKISFLFKGLFPSHFLNPCLGVYAGITVALSTINSNKHKIHTEQYKGSFAVNVIQITHRTKRLVL